MENEDKPFRDLNAAEKIVVIFVIALLIIFTLALVFGGYYFGLAGFFSLIGVTYDSWKSLLVFVFYCFLIGILFELLEKIILLITVHKSNSRRKNIVWILFVKLILTWLVVHIVDDIVTTISLSIFAEILTASLITAADVVLDDKELPRKGKT